MLAIADSTAARTREISSEDFLAELTRVAYETALQHGIKGKFTDLYLDIWHRLRDVVEEKFVSPFEERAALRIW